MPSPNEIKKGTVIKYEGNLWVVTDFQRVSPGKGSSFVRTRMKNISTGKVNEYNFKSAENMTFEDVQNKKMQYLYTDGTQFTFMDTVSYEQVPISADMLGDDVKYLKEGLEVAVVMHDGLALGIQLPRKIQYKVMYTEPAVKGDTASGNITKEVELDNGLTVRAPAFINQGDEIMINSENGEYVERISR
ncbi:MAG: Elongation factor P 2 [Candidatus Uhrbacteria bacterium GW2011_GWE2_40_58]|nr:MAG: Elongation factor P 2 [Candidatus Uhrbacteria bacterium GW2011_GWF2_40_263]KKR67101.1 MAG: Elongation factor P 2 [Candidatus Uhrbacteria bacterium GW2011_GWE2_40_58]OGL94483.1 MAG: elongation factor P [Candidatus Uhrbacteria bacterium RIFOXYA2_FULL_40_9]OGL97475.1 MAG: elongation factor P [Candidatus Uhrbacteria bacterium RIFOXYB2_FULL_41_18]HBK35211.1 elongation factor P [Candidatus Uhrbacteria bacterium]